MDFNFSFFLEQFLHFLLCFLDGLLLLKMLCWVNANEEMSWGRNVLHSSILRFFVSDSLVSVRFVCDSELSQSIDLKCAAKWLIVSFRVPSQDTYRLLLLVCESLSPFATNGVDVFSKLLSSDRELSSVKPSTPFQRKTFVTSSAVRTQRGHYLSSGQRRMCSSTSSAKRV